MRKLFALVLVGLAVTLGSGCRLIGNYDDGAGVAPASSKASSVVLEAKVPATLLGQSIRGALAPTDIVVTAGGLPLPYSSTLGGFLVFTRTITAADPAFATIMANGGGSIAVTVQVGTTAPVTLTITLDTTTGGGKSKNLSMTITITSDPAAGTITVTITGGPGLGAPDAPGLSEKSLGITGIDYLASGTYLPLASATGVPFSATTLKVTFDTLVDNATNNFQIKAESLGGNSVLLTHLDLGTVVSVTQTDVPAGTLPAHSYLIATLLTNTTQGKTFQGGKTYTLRFESASVSRRDDPQVRLRPFLTFARTFTTANP